MKLPGKLRFSLFFLFLLLGNCVNFVPERGPLGEAKGENPEGYGQQRVLGMEREFVDPTEAFPQESGNPEAAPVEGAELEEEARPAPLDLSGEEQFLY